MGQDRASFLKNQGWTVTVEELLPNRLASPDVASPFDLTVSEGNHAELYSGCVWLSTCREETAAGIRQIRVCYTQVRSLEDWVS